MIEKKIVLGVLYLIMAFGFLFLAILFIQMIPHLALVDKVDYGIVCFVSSFFGACLVGGIVILSEKK